MMHKRQLHHYAKKLHALSPWVIGGTFVVSSAVCIYALRQNNLHMLELKQAVASADKNNGDINGALRNLREYVYGHMNTDLTSGSNAIYPPIQLKYQYQRLIDAETKKVNADNSRIYTDAQNYCEKKIPNGLSGRYRISCIQSYVKAHGSKVKPIPAALYKFDFVSPIWSPDLAGLALLTSCLLLLVLLIRLLLGWLVRRELTRHT